MSSGDSGNEAAFEDKVVNGLKEDRLTGIRVSLSHPGHCETFFKLVKKTKKLATAEVGGYGADESSGKYIAEALKENKSITYLAIRRSKLGPNQLVAIADSLRGNQTLRTLILHNNLSSWGEFDGPASQFAAVLAKHQYMTRFEMTAHRIKDTACQNLGGMLSQNRTLTYLDLSENPITDEGVAKLCKGLGVNHALKHLLLCKLGLATPLALDSLATALVTNTALGRLGLDGNAAMFNSARSCERIAQSFESGRLTFLQLNECKLNDDFAAVFFRLISQQCPQLRKLHLCDNALTQRSVEALDWENAFWCSELHLNGNPLGSASGKRIARGLRLNRGFTSLSFIKCDFKDDAIREISEVLAESNATVTYLSTDAKDGGRGLTPEGNAALARNELIRKSLDALRKSEPTAPASASASPQSSPNAPPHMPRSASASPGGGGGSSPSLSVLHNTGLSREISTRFSTPPANWTPPANAPRDCSTELIARKATTSKEIVFSMGTKQLQLGRVGMQRPEALSAVLKEMASTLPAGALAEVRSLQLFANYFPSVPVLSLHLLKSLQSLELSFGALQSIPEEISRLKSLTTLDLRANQITTLPPQLGQLKTLATLHLQQNRIATVPQAVLENGALETLSLAGNNVPFPLDLLYPLWNHARVELARLKLKRLPMELFSMPRVEELYLNDNELPGLPQEIANLRLLRVLDLSNNQLNSLPWQLGQMTSLRSVNLRGNPLGSVPEEVAMGPVQHLLTYLLASKDGSAPSNRMKLMLVGEENVGKTSLTNVIRELWPPAEPQLSSQKKKRPTLIAKVKSAAGAGESDAKSAGGGGASGSPAEPLEAGDAETLAQYEQTIRTVSTDGIAVHDVAVWFAEDNTRAPREFRYAIWDFAGQEVYHNTHSFFISKRSLFLIMFNMSEPIETSARRTDYWLQVVNSRAGGSPALLVGTHLDNKKCTPEYVDQVRSFLVQRYNKRAKCLQGICFVSCKTRKRVKELLDEVNQIAAKQKHMSEELPKVYLALEEQCKVAGASLTPPIVTIEKFSEMAARCGIAKAQVPQVLEVLNQMGTLIYFSKGHDASKAVSSALDNLVVLDPMWLSTIFKAIVTFKNNFVENGMLAHRNAVHLWKEHTPAMHRVFLEILEKFEIAFPMSRAYREPTANTNNSSPEEERSLVPSLLPEEAPANLSAFGWVPPATGLVRRHYDLPFVPLGLLGRMIVRALSFASGNVYWRTGVVVSQRKNSTLAYLTTNGSTTISLQCYGTEPGPLMSVLDSNLLNLLDYVFKVDFEAFALCACPQCGSQPHEKAHKFPMQTIMAACTQGAQKMRCPKSGTDQDLATLAPDLSVAELSALTVQYKDLKLEQELGRGAFSVVYLTQFKGQAAAVKKLIQEGESTRVSGFAEFRQEAWIWQKLQHPTLVKLLGLCWQPFCFVMEVVPFGELTGHIRAMTPKQMPWNVRVKLATDIATGLNWLHSNNPPIMHRDLKSFNVLLASKNPSAPVMAKICDFGLCFVGYQTIGRHVDNPVWLAVEVMAGREYTYKADIYSLGIILWELLTCAEPFKEFGLEWLAELEDRIVGGLRPTIPDDAPDVWRTLCKSCWAEDPRERPTAEEVLKTLAAFKPPAS